MRVAALISGGKDSCHSMMKCIEEGHDIVALVNLKPKDKDELDSYMYQTVGHHAIDLYAEAMELPLYRRTIQGTSKEIGSVYLPTAEDEVEDLYQILKTVKEEVNIDAVSSGAILSDYQRVRVENVCQRLGLTSLAYLWRMDQKVLLEEMIDCGIHAIIIKVATLGLEPDKHLGLTLEQIYPHMIKMNEKYGLNICGEGGEYETFTLDCPLFRRKLVVDETETVMHTDQAFDPVGYLNFKKLHLEEKEKTHGNIVDRVKVLPFRVRGCNLVSDLLNEDEGDALTNPSASSLGSQQLAHVTDLQIQTRVCDEWWQVAGLLCKRDTHTSVADAARNVMETLKSTVEELGQQMQDLVYVCLYVHNMTDFACINSVYKTYFNINPPARVCVQATLPENVLLQIDCQGRTADAQETKQTMHVQSISHWASANIGPYSQAVKVDSKVFVAGQIPLSPASMTVVEGGAQVQARLCLRHVQSVLEAMHRRCGLHQVMLGICYVTSSEFITVAQREWERITQIESSTDYAGNAVCPQALLEFVVVPALPRGVLLEWQVYATTDEECQGDFISHVTQDNEYRISIDYRYSLDSKNIFSSRGVIEMKTKRWSNTYEVIKSYFNCYHKSLEKSLHNWSDVPLLRVFFKSTICSYTELYKTFQAVLSEISEAPPCFSLVPVLAMSHENHVISVCH